MTTFNLKLKLIVFDIDGTLTSFDEPVGYDASAIIGHLEDPGIRIALSSGKDIPYMERIARELGIKRPIIIAENGCVIVDVANKKEFWLANRTPEIYEIRERILNRFSDTLWEQSNKIEFTFSSKISILKSDVISYAKEVISHYADKVHAYVGSGCIDVLPAGIDKGTALAEVKRMYVFKKEEVAAIGDGENDIPMFEEAGLSLIVGLKISYPSALRFNVIGDALRFLNEHINGCSQ